MIMKGFFFTLGLILGTCITGFLLSFPLEARHREMQQWKNSQFVTEQSLWNYRSQASIWEEAFKTRTNYVRALPEIIIITNNVITTNFTFSLPAQ